MKELSPQKIGPALDCSTGPENGTVTEESSLTTTVDANTINTVQQTDFSNGAATALLQTIIKASQASRENENNTNTGEGTTGNIESQFSLPILQNISGALQTNGDVQAQQGPSFMINTPSSETEQSQKGLSRVEHTFGHAINSETVNNFQHFFANQNPGSDLRVNTDNHLNLNQESAHLESLPGFEGLAQVNTLGQDSPEYLNDKQPVLERLLTDQTVTDNSRISQSISSPDIQSACSPASSSNSPYTDRNGQDTSFMDHTSQGLTYTEMGPISIDTSTQSSLIARSEKLVLVDTPYPGVDEPHKEDNIEWSVTKLGDHELEQIGKPKMMRIGHERVVPLSVMSPSVEHVFDAESAMQGVTSEFTFHKFGQGGDGDQAFYQFGTEKKEVEGPSSPPIPFKTPHPVGFGARKREQARRSREPILSQQFPSRYQNYELKILSQPEEQHRARYLTEGSRGSVKNRGGQGYPSVKLMGHSGEATLQVFVGNDNGRVRPHGFYQACKVCGKNSTPCSERDIDGTTVIEIDLKSAHDMTASVDCVGILKLRNADVEQRIGIAKAKKKSTKARMVFRVTFQKPCGNPQVLQVASAPILCTQPIGQPEICKMSLKESLVGGGEELYIIGKNFLRGTRVCFQELNEDEMIVWENDGEIAKDYFQTTHMIVKIPEYGRPLQPGMSVLCQVVANSGDKVSEPQSFTYRAEEMKAPIKLEVPMDTNEDSRKRNYPFVAPEALELNQQIQQPSKTSEMFQIPAAVMSGVIQQQQQQQQQVTNNSSISQPDVQEVNTQNENQTFQQQQSPLTEHGNDADCLNLNHVGFSIDMNTFNTDTVGSLPDQNWDTNKPAEPAKAYTSMENEASDVIFPMNTDERYTDQTNDTSLNRIKSPILSTDSFQTDHGLSSSIYTSDSFDLNNTTGISTSESNMISQFLQNFQNSEPMLNTSNTSQLSAGVEQVVDQSTSSIFSSGPNTPVTPKIVDQSCSHLKEALTCPASSLQDFSNFTHITNSSLAVGQIPAQQDCNRDLKVVGSDLNLSKETLNSTMILSPNNNGTFNPSQNVFSPVQPVPNPSLNLQSSNQSSNGTIQSFFNQQPVMSPSTIISAGSSNSTVYSSPVPINHSNITNTPTMVNNQLSQLLSTVVSSSQLQNASCSLPWNTITTVAPTPAAVTAPVVSTPSVGPQIIICNPGQQQASQASTGFGGAPSIVIMPAQNGQNNQVESLLRSILGSMMGPQQQPPPSNQQ